jgi:hypothetical protein
VSGSLENGSQRVDSRTRAAARGAALTSPGLPARMVAGQMHDPCGVRSPGWPGEKSLRPIGIGSVKMIAYLANSKAAAPSDAINLKDGTAQRTGIV